MNRGPLPELAAAALRRAPAPREPSFWKAWPRVAELKLEHRRILYYMDVVGLTQKETAERLQKDEYGKERLSSVEAGVLRSYGEISAWPRCSVAFRRGKTKGYDIAKAAALDSLWGECQADLEALPPEDSQLIDLHLCWDGTKAENAERLQMDLSTFRAKRDALISRLSPMIQDLLKK